MKVYLSIVVLLLLAGVLKAQVSDKGVVVYRLGNDTTNVQYFEYTNHKYKTTIVQLSGSITKCEATGELDKDGDIIKVSSINYQLDANGNWQQTTTGINNYNGDSSIYVATGKQGVVTRRSFPGKGIVANGMDVGSFLLFPFMGFSAPSKTGDTLFHRQLSFSSFRKFIVTRVSENKIRVGSNLMGYVNLIVDKNNRLLSADAIGSSLNFVADVSRNTDRVMLEDIAKRQANRGAAVTRAFRDTAEIIINGKKMEMDYWRPYRRGRDIFGSVVPWNRGWRTGANNATQLRTETGININGNTIPAGKYGIWSYPGENKWELIINKNAGAWGTDHDPSADLLRVPLKIEKLSSPIEIFTISLVPAGEAKGMIVIEWDFYKASVEFIAQ